MNILLIEDDPVKSEAIQRFISGFLPGAVLRSVSSYQSGLEESIDTDADVIVLDMSMPTFDITTDEAGGDPQWYAGRDILYQLALRGLKRRVIVVTAFESFGEGASRKTLKELTDDLSSEFSDNFVGSIYYQPSRSYWKQELGRLISLESTPKRKARDGSQ